MSIEMSARSRGAELSDEERKVLTATLVGTTIEWYDFFVYAQAAGLVCPLIVTWAISLQFSPSTTSGPMLQYGPISVPAPITAPSAIRAVGSIMLMQVRSGIREWRQSAMLSGSAVVSATLPALSSDVS